MLPRTSKVVMKAALLVKAGIVNNSFLADSSIKSDCQKSILSEISFGPHFALIGLNFLKRAQDQRTKKKISIFCQTIRKSVSAVKTYHIQRNSISQNHHLPTDRRTDTCFAARKKVFCQTKCVNETVLNATRLYL